MTSTLPPGLLRNAAEVIAEAANRPILDVEYYRFEGKTSVVDEELERLKKEVVRPTFKTPPHWHAARDVIGFAIGLPLFPILGLVLAYLEAPSLFWLSGPLLVLASAGMAFALYWTMYHMIEVQPKGGKYGEADPDQAYKGLTLIIRDVIRSEGYGYKLVRAEALIAHNYGFTIIPSEGSKERLYITIYKHYDDDDLNIQINRASGEKRPTYLKFKNAIEERLARQVV